MIQYPWLADYQTGFVNQIHKRNVHHGILLSGQDGIGLESLAEWMAATLLCQDPTNSGPCGQCQGCSLIGAQTHPDLHLIESEKQVGVDAIRQGITKLAGTAQLKGNKVLVIQGADTMTEAAANALLKTLEEPTPQTYIVLVSVNSHKLLPTIKSRCDKRNFAHPSTAQCQTWLHAQGYTDVSEQLIKVYRHGPLTIAAGIEKLGVEHVRDLDRLFSELIRGQVDVVEAATKWLDSADLVIQMAKYHAEQDYKATSTSLTFQRYQDLIELSATLNQNGVNKSLVLTRALSLYV